jgi:hypothetical protein
MANIDQTKQLNKLLEQQAKLYQAQEASLKNQLNIARQLARALRESGMEETAEAAQSLNKAVGDAANAVNKMDQGQQTMERMRDAVRGAIEESDEFDSSITKLGKSLLKLTPVVATVEGMVGGFRLLGGVMSSAMSIGTGLVSTLVQVSAAIIAAPFKLLGWLMGQAARGGGNELRQAIENVRKEFGSLHKNEGKAIMKTFWGMNHFGGQLAETGLSIHRTLGFMAEALKHITEMATQIGPLFNTFMGEFRDSLKAQRLFAYQKGLGLTEEGFKGLATRAAAAGTEMSEMGRQVTQMAYGMGSAFGINGKIISRQVGEMMSDMANFGGLAVRELTEIAVYTRKLGVEVKALLGTIDQFDNFEDAATSVAQLSQAFGLQLDTLEMMNAQNPAERTEMIRKAFHAAGRSVENMTRQEKALLAAQSGIEQGAVDLVFSQKNAGLSYADIQKKSKATEKQQLSQAEAMKTLADSIERLVRQGGQMPSSFFAIFIKGFERGVRWTKEWWTLMRRLRRAMRMTYRAGRAVGQAFVRTFPGVKQMIGGLAELFDVRRWRKMMRGIVRSFKTFFTDLSSPSSKFALPNLLKNLQKNFFDWFDTSKSSGRKFIGGVKKFTKAFVQVAGTLFAEAMKALGAAFKGIANFIRDPSAVLGAASRTGEGFLGFLMEALRPAFAAIKEAWPVLRDGFMDLVETAWEKLQPPLMKFLKRNIVKALIFAFAPAMIGGAARGIAAGLGVLFTKSIGMAFAGRQTRAMTNAMSEGFGKMSTALGRLPQAPAGGGVGPVAAGAGQMRQVNTATRGFGIREATALGAKLVAIAGAIAIGGVLFATSLIAIKAILEAGGINNVIDAALPLFILAAATGAMILVSLASKGLQPSAVGQMGVNMVVAATALAVGGVLFAGALAIISGVINAAGLTSLEAIGWPFLVLGAAVLGTIALVLAALTLEPTTVSIATGMMLLGALALTLGGLAFVGALAAISGVLSAADLDTVDKVKFPLMVLVGAAGAMVTLSLAMLAMAAVANPLVIVAGFIGMIVVMEVAERAIDGLKTMRDKLKDFSATDIDLIVRGVSGMAIIYGAAAAFALAAAGVGGIVLSLGGGVALIAGLAALAVITEKGTDHAIEIIDKIKSVNLGANIKEKTEIFVTILKGMGSFAASMASVMNAASPSFVSLLAHPWGRNPERETKQNIGMITELVEVMGSEINDLIMTIVDSLRGISPRQIKAGAALAPLISAVSELANALKPDASLTEGLFGDLLSVQTLLAAREYLKSAGAEIVRLVPVMQLLMQSIDRAPSIDESKIKAFSTFIEGIGGMMQALSPTGGAAALLGGAGLIEGAESVITTIGNAITGENVQGPDRVGQVISYMQRFAQGLLQAFTGGGFLETMKAFIGSMGDIASNLNAEQIKGLEVVSSIFQAIVSVVQQLAEAFADENFLKAITGGGSISPGVVGAAFNGLVNGIISPMQEHMPNIINGLKDVSAGMRASDVENLSAVVDVFGSVIATTSSLSEMIQGMSASSGGTTGGLKAHLAQMGEVLSVLFGSESPMGSAIENLGRISLPRGASRKVEVVAKVLEAMQSIADLASGTTLATLVTQAPLLNSAFSALFTEDAPWITALQHIRGLPRNLSADTESLRDALENISRTEFGPSITKLQALPGQIGDQFTENVTNSFTALVTTVRNTGSALRRLGRTNINLQADMDRVNNSLQLQGGQRLSFSQHPVQFNVSLRVVMDTEDFAKAFIEHPRVKVQVTEP